MSAIHWSAESCRRQYLLVTGLALGLLAGAGPTAFTQNGSRPVKVTVEEVKTDVSEPVLPVEPQVRVRATFTGMMSYGLQGEGGKRLMFSDGAARTNFRIDNNNVWPGNAVQQPLPQGPRRKQRHGVLSTFAQGDLHITQTIEIVPGKRGEKVAPGTKRFLDTLLIRYTVENRGNQPHSVGVRMRMDTYNVDNDGCLFAAPTTRPNEILDGVVLQGKDVPPYLLSLQRPDLQAPGNIAYYTFKLGSKLEPPTRVMPTWHGAGDNGWDVPPMKANGDSDIVFYWDPKVIQPKGKREMAYAYGEGIASNPENEGKVTLALGGSFEPNKTFTVTAYVEDPVESQSLTLELPAGMDYLEGKVIQPVPPPSDEGRSIVFWKGRVLRPGQYSVRVRSSNGVTHSRTVTITPTANAAPGKDS